MGYVINLKGDFRGVDLNRLESYLSKLVESQTGTPTSRVVFHGVARPDPDETRRQLRRLQGARASQ